MKIVAISTTTHKFDESASSAAIRAILRECKARGYEVRIINADKLHIVKNLSCYAGGAKNCASYDAGEYRCWAHKSSLEDPEKFGGIDEMPVLYDAMMDSDIVLFCTSVRWMSHSAVMQAIIERMNTLENRVTVYGEESPLKGKKCGVVTVGQHYKAQDVARHIMEVMGFMGFEAPDQAMFVWQKTLDLNKEQGDNSNIGAARSYLESEKGIMQMEKFLNALEI